MANNNGFPNDEENPEIDLTLRLGLPYQNDHQVNRNASNVNQNHLAIIAGPPNYVFNVAFVNQVLGARPNARRNNNVYIDDNNNMVIRTCKVCGANWTPLWRRGPLGRRTLCNACGLRHLRAESKNAAKRREGGGGGDHGGGANGNTAAVC